MDDRIKSVLKFYLLATSLKYKIRQGWLYWNVEKERLESVAEHIYGTCILAIGMDSEFDFNIDINKVIKMLTIHELEEVIIGDLTPFDISEEEKLEKGHHAIDLILDGLLKKNELVNLILEFDERKTNEAKFAYYCDKFEADLQCRIYEEMDCTHLDKNEDNPALKNEKVIKIIENGASSMFEVWYNFDKDKFSDDEVFVRSLKYIKDNGIYNK